MQRYNVPEMSCGHCVSTIEAAVKKVDPNAVISADLAGHQVTVQTQIDADRIADAIHSAGYQNEPLAG
ncbi:MAG TPA: heavy-metal-associated domain-containing protein [Caulobacteraceae bacterium]|jgi:copper chaperone|nr:heavy-metal-associated domain-containing protein [Caulobacteraceae bacterium]